MMNGGIKLPRKRPRLNSAIAKIGGTTHILAENISPLIEAILEKNPMHRGFMNAALENMRPEEQEHLSRYLEFCRMRGLSEDYLSDCYLTILGDTLREQIYFLTNSSYRYSTFKEVAEEVYFNDAYMSQYMYGLAITTFLWPNHLALLRFFRETLPTDRSGAYIEVGPGHGFFLMTAMESSAYVDFLGIDLSETSIAQTNAIAEHYGRGKHKHCELRCADFLHCDLPEDAFDAVVMGEVLEHVERPELFLTRIARIAKRTAHIFVTTCINAPAVDHIYLFKNPEQLEKLFEDCGLRIKNQLIMPYKGKTVEQSLSQRFAINVGYVLEKK
jgi:ubiquinone/menaquinone biosynthesis C-methylase UbiE